MSEYSSHRSLEQDCPVVQMLTNWRWVSPIQARHEVFLTSTGRSRLHVFPSAYLQIWKKAVEQKVQSVFQFEVVAPPNVNKPASLFQRYAVPSTEATCHRWREDHYSEPDRPAEVHVERAGLGGDGFISYHSWSIYTFQILILMNLSSTSVLPHMLPYRVAACYVVKLVKLLPTAIALGNNEGASSPRLYFGFFF